MPVFILAMVFYCLVMGTTLMFYSLVERKTRPPVTKHVFISDPLEGSSFEEEIRELSPYFSEEELKEVLTELKSVADPLGWEKELEQKIIHEHTRKA